VSYQLSLENKEEYLHAHVRGTRTRESVITLARGLLEACIEMKHSKLIVDVKEFEGRLSPFDIYSFVTEEIPKLRGKGLNKAAIVDNTAPRVGRWFFETVARNRGYYNLQMFEDLGSAHEWLIGGEES
jgi:hypothetical protein